VAGGPDDHVGIVAAAGGEAHRVPVGLDETGVDRTPACLSFRRLLGVRPEPLLAITETPARRATRL
jgi:hypothetical protein